MYRVTAIGSGNKLLQSFDKSRARSRLRASFCFDFTMIVQNATFCNLRFQVLNKYPCNIYCTSCSSWRNVSLTKSLWSYIVWTDMLCRVPFLWTFTSHSSRQNVLIHKSSSMVADSTPTDKRKRPKPFQISQSVTVEVTAYCMGSTHQAFCQTRLIQHIM